jgi:hypothetical protein
LPERISNRSVDINIEGVNNEDVWLYQLDNLGNLVFTRLTSAMTNSGNLIVSSISNNKIAYNSSKQYTMTNGTYVFFNMSGLFITFMTNNKKVTSSGVNVGFNFISGNAPNGDVYTFNKSTQSISALLNPIIVKVTGNFGYLSICTLSGYNGGKNLIAYSQN